MCSRCQATRPPHLYGIGTDAHRTSPVLPAICRSSSSSSSWSRRSACSSWMRRWCPRRGTWTSSCWGRHRGSGARWEGTGLEGEYEQNIMKSLSRTRQPWSQCPHPFPNLPSPLPTHHQTWWTVGARAPEPEPVVDANQDRAINILLSIVGMHLFES